jgi:hypothetical protein
MPAAARDHLESLLRLRKLDHTLMGAVDDVPVGDSERWLIPTGIADLDARLHGGIARGELSEVIGPRSSGRLALVLSALAGATARGEVVALVDPLDMFDPVSASASGVDFARMLWVRGEATGSPRVSLSCEYGTLQKSVDRAVKAINLILQAGGLDLVVLDLAEGSSQVLRRLPPTTWLRLHRVIEGSQTACVLTGAEHMARSARGVTIQLASGSGLQAAGLTARVIRSRAVESDRDVCVPLSAAAC